MPHSPYIQQVHPQISDGGLVTFRNHLQRIRWDYENNVRDKYAVETALNIGEPLIEQCEFLEAKLTIKKHENFQLATQSEALETKIEALETEIEVLKDENKAYKQELAALKAKLDMEKEVVSSGGLVKSSQLAAAPPASSPRKRELDSDSDTTPMKGGRVMVATWRRRGLRKGQGIASLPKAGKLRS